MASRPACSSRWIDRLGVIASVGCGVHCAALSVVILLYPTIWLHRGLRESGFWALLWWTELGLLAVAWLLAVVAGSLAWLRDRTLAVPMLAAAGLGLLTWSIVSPLHGRAPWVSALALCGGILVASAHVLNLRRRRLHRGAG